MTKIMLVDNHQLFRAGLLQILNSTPGYEVVAQAETGEQALRSIRKTELDIVLMDIKISGIGGLDTIKKIKRMRDDIKILVVTACEDAPFPSRAMQAGADGYLSKNDCQDNLIRAVRIVMAGQYYITASIAQEMAVKTYSEYNNPFDALSERELQVMSLITQCYKVRDIAEQLYLSPKTINTYRYRIYGKLGVDSDVGMAMMAMQHGILTGKRRNQGLEFE